LWISLAAFAAIAAGSFWLVRLGLSPLRRLSEAVSKVSEKDFRLPFNQAEVPRELQPIVERLTQTLDSLKRAFAREKQAAADISHDLRTPLAALLTTTEVALRKPRSPEEYRELLLDCQESGRQMSNLVERLLALARLDAGVDILRPCEVDAAALAEQCASLVRPLAEARGLDLRTHIQGPAPVTTDPNGLREVITNLLANAIQYNRPEGTIDLVVEQDNGSLRVEVHDSGIGIPAAAREQIFQRFYRGDPSRSSDGLHAGLGLAIVKGYIDLMGGTIRVDSTEGKGSTFRVDLPSTQRATTRPQEDAFLARL
jgi:heavy metal sensor kinase